MEFGLSGVEVENCWGLGRGAGLREGAFGGAEGRVGRVGRGSKEGFWRAFGFWGRGGEGLGAGWKVAARCNGGGLDSSSSKSISLPIFSLLALEVVSEYVALDSRRGGNGGRSRRSGVDLRDHKLPLDNLPRTGDCDPRFRRVLVEESKKPLTVVVTSRMNTPSTLPGLDKTTSV